MINIRQWKEIQKKALRCGCCKNNKQQKLSAELDRKNRMAYKFEQKEYCVDKCGNSFKINLMDLKKILGAIK